MRPFDLDSVGMTPVVLGNDARDERAIGVQRREVIRAAQHQRLIDPVLHMTVPALDRPILMRDAAVVAGRHHKGHHSGRATTSLHDAPYRQFDEAAGRPSTYPSPIPVQTNLATFVLWNDDLGRENEARKIELHNPGVGPAH